jgi:hypothetical protein
VCQVWSECENSLGHEMHVSGEWTDIVANKNAKKEWVAAIKGKIGVESDRNERVSSNMKCLRLNQKLVW